MMFPGFNFLTFGPEHFEEGGGEDDPGPACGVAVVEPEPLSGTCSVLSRSASTPSIVTSRSVLVE